MRFKSWLPSKKATPDHQLTVDELMAVDRHDEAKSQLLERLRHNPDDLHAHLKLGDAYRHLGQVESCQEEYLHVARSYAEDGFYDRARAVLQKISRFFPDEFNVEAQMIALQRAKNLEYSRDQARAGLLSHQRLSDTKTGVKAIEFERVWNALSRTTLIDRLSSQDFAQLFESAEIRRLDARTVVADPRAEGTERRQAAFVVVSGSLEATVPDSSGHPVALRSFGPGEIVGATVLFENLPWPALYRCRESTTVLELNQEGAARLVGGDSDADGLLTVLQDGSNDVIVRRAVAHLEA